jgi:hypothetical protein
MLERFKPIDDSTAAVRVAHACSLAPGAVTDVSGLVQVSERWTLWVAGKDLPGLTSISNLSNRWLAISERGVGAVLFRAGLPQDALERFERAHKVLAPRAWDLLLLAMIRNRLAHTSEARRLLQQADQWIVEADIAPPGTQREGPSWRSETERTTIMLLRREAEALLSADAIFPADPFAP